MAAQVLTNSNGGGSTFTGGADELFDTASTNIASCENAFSAGLEINASKNKALCIYFRDIGKRFAVGRKAHKNKDARRVVAPPRI